MSVYKGVGGCKGVLKSGVYIERKLQVKYGVYPPFKKIKTQHITVNYYYR